MTTDVKDSGAMNRPPKEPDKSTYQGRLGARLRQLRTDAGLSIEEAAIRIAKAGYQITEPTLYRWENGHGWPHAQSFPALAKVYGVKLPELLPAK